jgi:hypothetical protein
MVDAAPRPFHAAPGIPMGSRSDRATDFLSSLLAFLRSVGLDHERGQLGDAVSLEAVNVDSQQFCI